MQHTYSHESEALHVLLDGDKQWGAICAKSSTDSTLLHSVPIQMLYVTD